MLHSISPRLLSTGTRYCNFGRGHEWQKQFGIRSAHPGLAKQTRSRLNGPPRLTALTLIELATFIESLIVSADPPLACIDCNLRNVRITFEIHIHGRVVAFQRYKRPPTQFHLRVFLFSAPCLLTPTSSVRVAIEAKDKQCSPRGRIADTSLQRRRYSSHSSFSEPSFAPLRLGQMDWFLEYSTSMAALRQRFHVMTSLAQMRHWSY